MNYRHAFHAGNFADCFKHALLIRLLAMMQRKPAGVFVLDTHAGVGAYDLGADAATRTGEWRQGIARVRASRDPALTEYLALLPLPLRERAGVRGATPAQLSGVGVAPLPRPLPHGEGRSEYPGSPVLLRAMLRPQDRLACCELHPEDHAALRRRFRRDPQVAVHLRDGWEALAGLLPPTLTRALVLIDPPYEAPDEFARLAAGLRTAWRRMPHAVLAAWYPIKHRAPIRPLQEAVATAGLRDVIAAELHLRAPLDATRLNGCGLVVVNPPFGFADEIGPILAALLLALGDRAPGEGLSVERWTDE